MVMMVMVAMMRLGVRGNNRPGQNDECNGSKEQRAQLHDELPLTQPLSGVVCRLVAAYPDYR